MYEIDESGKYRMNGGGNKNKKKNNPMHTTEKMTLNLNDSTTNQAKCRTSFCASNQLLQLKRKQKKFINKN